MYNSCLYFDLIHPSFGSSRISTVGMVPLSNTADVAADACVSHVTLIFASVKCALFGFFLLLLGLSWDSIRLQTKALRYRIPSYLIFWFRFSALAISCECTVLLDVLLFPWYCTALLPFLSLLLCLFFCLSFSTILVAVDVSTVRWEPIYFRWWIGHTKSVPALFMSVGQLDALWLSMTLCSLSHKCRTSKEHNLIFLCSMFLVP